MTNSRMPSDQPIIYPLFSTPVYYVRDTGFRLDDPVLDQLLDTANIPSLNSECGLSKDVFIFDRPELYEARKTCEYHLNEYVKNICGFTDEFYITNSWLSRNEPGVPHHEHYHLNSIFSGCLYLRSSPDSQMQYSGKNHFSRHWPLTFHKTEAYNIYNSEKWWVPVDTGCIVIWPSDVNHSSSPNPLDDTRIVVCFNTFIRGNMGDTGVYVTDLVLK